MGATVGPSGSAAGASHGFTRSGLPLNRSGIGPYPLVVLQGLLFENKPLRGVEAWGMLGLYRFLGERFTVYVISRRPGLPVGYAMADMARDYATTIRQEFGEAVDVIGTSTGGSIALHLAADHPDVVRRLVIHSSAHTLGDAGKRVQLEVGALAAEHLWREAWAALLRFTIPTGALSRPVVWLASHLMAMGAPDDPSDLVITIEAEDRHAFRERLGEIVAPTLVVGGARDPFYSEKLFRETAEGIPDARLVVYPRMGHPAGGQRYRREVLAFLAD